MTGRFWISRTAAAVFVVAVGTMRVPVARAADEVTGEVVDLACYLHDPSMKGPAHRKCAETCAKKKIPMGVLTDDGKVYVLLEDHDNPKGYADALAKAAQKVTVSGEKVTQGGVNGVVVESVK